MNTCLVWGSSCRMSSTSPGKSFATVTAASFSPSGAALKKSLIDSREQERCVGKELLSIFAREDRRGASNGHDQVRLGTIGEGGTDVVNNRLFRGADKPCWTHDDLDEVHGSPRALVEVYAEVAGEAVKDHVAAIERLQHQDLADRRLRFARRGSEHQQARQRDASCHCFFGFLIRAP